MFPRHALAPQRIINHQLHYIFGLSHCAPLPDHFLSHVLQTHNADNQAKHYTNYNSSPSPRCAEGRNARDKGRKRKIKVPIIIVLNSLLFSSSFKLLQQQTRRFFLKRLISDASETRLTQNKKYKKDSFLGHHH